MSCVFIAVRVVYDTSSKDQQRADTCRIMHGKLCDIDKDGCASWRGAWNLVPELGGLGLGWTCAATAGCECTCTTTLYPSLLGTLGLIP